ncbi:MAG: aminofutalosine synthase MqnE [Desulfovibrio sp.]|nr:aminofutalosine synthase MqnE [Desulfovibrio sp.]
MFDETYYQGLGLGGAYRKIMCAERLSEADGEALFACPDVTALGALAHHVRTRMHGNNAYYVRNRHINYSNICVNRCRFCAFRREADGDGAFMLSAEEILARVCDDQGVPFAEIHVVGGCHPELRLAWFEELFAEIRKARPHAELKAFTVTEIHNLACIEHCSTREVLLRLRQCGVDMLTGGGAEIFASEIRKCICPEKISGDEYLRISGEAHSLGIASNCTMMFGHVENFADRVRHLCALREQQDKSGGFVCFIPLPYQPLHNPLAAELPGLAGGVGAGLDRLRTIAVSRLMLDNIAHLKAYWIMLGIKCAQAALSFGADDLDGTIMEEHIGNMAGAGAGQALSRAELEDMIRRSGFTPVGRTARFATLRAD